MTILFNIICIAYGANIAAPKTINKIPIKNTVLFEAIKMRLFK